MQSRARAWKTCRRDGSFNRPGTRAVPTYSRSGAQSSRGHVIRSVKFFVITGSWPRLRVVSRFPSSCSLSAVLTLPWRFTKEACRFWNRRCLVRSGILLHYATFRSRSRLEHRIIKKLLICKQKWLTGGPCPPPPLSTANAIPSTAFRVSRPQYSRSLYIYKLFSLAF